MKKTYFILSILLLVTFNIQAQLAYTDWACSVSAFYSRWDNNIASDKQDNIYYAGAFRGVIDIDPGPAVFHLTAIDSSDGFIAKLDAAGNFKWAHSIGNKYTMYVSNVTTDDSGFVYALGCFIDTADFDPSSGTDIHVGEGGYSLFILKFDSSGNYLWGKDIDGAINPSGLEVSTKGEIIVLGSYKDSADFDPGFGEFWLKDNASFVLSLSTYDGSFHWAKSIGSGGTCAIFDMALDAGDYICLAGWLVGPIDMDPGPATYLLNGRGSFVARYTDSGELVFANAFIADTGSGINIYSIATNKDKNILVSGGFYGAVDFDPGTGITKMYTKSRVPQAFVFQQDSSGKLNWVKFCSSTSGFAMLRSLAVDDEGSIFANGYYDGIIDTVAGLPISGFPSYGAQDIFVVKLDRSGAFQWLKGMGGSGSDFSGGIITDTKGNIIHSGLFSYTIAFDPDGVFYLNAIAPGDYFIHKMKVVPLSVSEQSPDWQGEVYPNPVYTAVTVKGLEAGMELIVTDMSGRELIRQKAQSATERLNTEALPQGQYILQIRKEALPVASAKMTKQ